MATKEQRIEGLILAQDLLRKAIEIMDAIANYDEQPDKYHEVYTRNAIDNMVDDGRTASQSIQGWLDSIEAGDDEPDKDDDDESEIPDPDELTDEADEFLGALESDQPDDEPDGDAWADESQRLNDNL